MPTIDELTLFGANSNLKSPREEFEQLLLSTNRKGATELLSALKKTDFFDAPASTVFHGNYKGGLLDHSLNVYEVAKQLREDMIVMKPELVDFLPEDSVIITALLHDVCKANIYKEVTKYRKDERNQWETYKTYTVDYSEIPIGHGEKSVIRLLRWGLELTDDEILAIRWHMSAWDLAFNSSEARACIGQAKNDCPLLNIIQAADGLSSSLIDEMK